MTSGRHDFTLPTFVVRQLGLENLLTQKVADNNEETATSSPHT